MGKSCRALVALVALLLACGGSGERREARPTTTTSSTRPKAWDSRRSAPSGVGTIVGTVRLAGPAPKRTRLVVDRDLAGCGAPPPPAEDLLLGKSGAIRGAVVWVESLTGPPPAIPKTPPVIEERGCRFVPRIVLLPAGGTLELRNADGILHDVRTTSVRNPPFERAQSLVHPHIQERFDFPEIVGIGCAVHPWEQAWLVVQAHRHYAITDAEGAFRLPGVPAGPHRLTVWHERLGTHTERIMVDPERDAEVVLTLSATREARERDDG